VIATSLWMMGAGWLGVTWIGYPAWLAVRSVVSPRPLRRDGAGVSRVVIVCVAKNEVHHVERRFSELAALDRIGLEVSVIFVDDGSTDGTRERVEAVIGALAQRGLAVTVVDGGPGKAMGIVRGLEVARSSNPEVVVFCDMRQRIRTDALTKLLAPFCDSEVGAASGVVVKPATSAGGWYWLYESWVRRLESRTGSTIGATGPWHAVRTDHLPREGEAAPSEVEGLLLDDVWLPMEALMRGARVVVAEDAVVEDVEHARDIERKKKARTLTGNLQLLRRWPALMSPKNPCFSRYLIHKTMRLGTPWAVGAMLVAPWVGAVLPGPFRAAWAPMAAGEVVATAGILATRPGREVVALVAASAEAWSRFWRGDARW